MHSSTETSLETARQNVLIWLRSASGDPNRPTSHAVIPSFLRAATDAGFGYEIVKCNQAGEIAYEIHWTHRGASFVGFKQPPAEASPEAALLAGCAALLQNEWCRKWLEQQRS